MTAIWQNDGSGWHLLSPTGFANEEKLHTLVEKAPHLLPLAGTPRLIVLGREVQLGNGYADLVAIEPTGRIARIEQSIMPIKQGNTTREVSQELLDALTDSYREAVGGEIEV